MVYADEALNQLRQVLNRLKLGYEVSNSDDVLVSLAVSVEGTEFCVWFDVQKQLYGFDLVSGGCKTYADVEQLEAYLSTYLQCILTFVPRAKIVANLFEVVIDVTTVYDKLKGSQEKGYTATFRVLGSELKAVTVTKVTDEYNVKFLEYTEDRKKFKLLHEYVYEFDESGEAVLLPNVYSYIDRIYSEYENSEDVHITRTQFDVFVFTIKDLPITAKVCFIYTDIYYEILKVGEVEYNRTLKGLANPYSLEYLYMECSQWVLDQNEEELPSEDFAEGDEDLVTSEAEEPAEEIVEEVNEDNIQEVVDEGSINEENDTEVEAEKAEESDNWGGENAVSEPDIRSEDSEMSVVVKVVKREEADIYLQFNQDGKFFNIAVAKAESMGVPIHMIHDSVELISVHGISMSTDEQAAKCFAKDVTADDDKCVELVMSLFD